MKKGNKRGPAYAYNVKELRDQEMAIAEQAERAYEQFVGQWRPEAWQEAHGRRNRGRVIVIRRPGEASSRRPAVRHAVARAGRKIARPRKGSCRSHPSWQG